MNTYQSSETRLTKDCIFEALMVLMERKAFDKITITEITKKAGVSRMAYYRHFTSKEAIFKNHLEDMFVDYKSSVINHKNNLFHAACLFFSFFRTHQAMVQNIQKAHLEMLLLKEFKAYIHHLLPHLDVIKYKKDDFSYTIDFMAGGMFEILMAWSKEGMKDSDEKMGALGERFIKSLLLKEKY